MVRNKGLVLLAALAVGGGAGCEFGDNLAHVEGPVGGADAGPGGADAGPGGADAPVGGPDAAASEADAAAPCTLVPQSGCGAGEACDLDPDALDAAATACRPVDDQGGPDDACAADVECAAGRSCVEESPGAAACLGYCVDDGDCDGPGSLCVVGVTYDEDGTTLLVPGIWMCTQSCDPLDAAGCPTASACRVDRDDLERDYTICRIPGAGGQGDSCAGDEDCDTTHWCVSVDGEPQCLRVCEPGAADACGDEPQTECHGFIDPVDVAGTEYGACL